MRTRLALIGLAVAAGLGWGMNSARADVEFSAGIEIHSDSDFYDPLAAFGEWVDVPPYGRCWRPKVAADWRPYCDGRWEWTDVGWYWQSDEPWAWACYHYGSWIDDPDYQWCWVPATEWAPAWVVWRESPDYIGWAPCGPGGTVETPSLFVFVDIHHFRDPMRRSNVILHNASIVNRTRIVNNIRTENVRIAGTERRVHVNRGPGVELIQRATGEKLAARPITEVVRQTPIPRKVPTKPSSIGKARPQFREHPPESTGRQQPRVYRQPEEAPSSRGPSGPAIGVTNHVGPEKPKIENPRGRELPPTGRETAPGPVPNNRPRNEQLGPPRQHAPGFQAQPPSREGEPGHSDGKKHDKDRQP
jgi:Family of unknown function (DUF6600)